MKKTIIALLLAGLLIAGCGDFYVLNMAVKDGKLQRELVKNPGKNSSSDKGVLISDEAVVGDFTGQYDNRGFFAEKSCPLGKAYVYIEDSRGSYNTAEQIENIKVAVDNFIPLVQVWAKSRFGQMEGYDKLDKFITGQFHKDLADLAIIAWVLANDTQLSTKGNDQEADIEHVRMVQMAMFLLKRGYINQKVLSNEILSPGSVLEGALCKGIINKIDLEGNICQKMLELASDFDKLTIDFNDVIMSTEDYKKFAAEYVKSQPQTKPADESSKKENYIKEYYEYKKIYTPLDSMFMQSYALSVNLKIEGTPAITNGELDDKKQLITWSSSILIKGKIRDHLPQTLYAIWAVPDDPWQNKHLGKSLVTSDNLASFVAFYNSLNEKQKHQCDEFLESLTPENYITKVKEFKFTPEDDKKRFPVECFDAKLTSQPTTQPTSKPTTRRSPGPRVMKFYDVETKEIVTINPKTADREFMMCRPGMKAKNPQTGKQTLVPMMRCPVCEKWFVTDEMIKGTIHIRPDTKLICTECGIDINEYYRKKRRQSCMKKSKVSNNN